jgi:ComEC/Rec2-related protein
MIERSLFARRPALTAILLFILGIFISLIFQFPYAVPLILLISALFALTIAYLKGKMQVASYLAAVLIILLGWYLAKLQSGPFPANHIENLASSGGRVELVGKVVDEPDIRSDRTYLVIEPDSLYRNRVWIPTFGRLRAGVTDGGSRYQYADILRLSGFLYQPDGPRNPGAFDYKGYLRNKEIFAALSVSEPNQVVVLRQGSSFLTAVISPLRNWLVGRTRENLPALSAALLSGFILGEQRDIPDEYQDLFRNTGTLHLMAVSGSNVGLVLVIFAFPLTLLRVPRLIKTIILMILVIFFAILTRLQPSVVRASIMAIIGLVAYGWLKKPDYINLLSLAGLLMLLWRPLQLFDVGMELSFAATFGIIYAVPKVNSWLAPLKGRWGGYLRNFLVLIASTFAAQAAVMPLMARYFQNVPVSGILANIPMIFLASAATVLGIVFYFSNILGGWLAHLISIPLGWILQSTVAVLRFFAAFPYANLKVASPGWPVIILFWTVLYIVYEILAKRRLSKLSIVIILIVSNILIWGNLFKPRTDWSLEFLDLGRNHAWIYSGNNQPTIACYDCYVTQEDVDNTLTPHLLNHHGGQLDYLFTTTPDSSGVKQLCSIFKPELFSFSHCDSEFRISPITPFKEYGYSGQSNFPANIKIIWKESDNTDEHKKSLPAFIIGEGSLILGDWTGAEILDGLKMTQVRLLELPWSIYAQSSCLNAIERINPEVVVFSPDRYSQAMPKGREELTHSAQRILSTSLYGGISVTGTDSVVRIETMKPFVSERK